MSLREENGGGGGEGGRDREVVGEGKKRRDQIICIQYILTDDNLEMMLKHVTTRSRQIDGKGIIIIIIIKERDKRISIPAQIKNSNTKCCF